MRGAAPARRRRAAGIYLLRQVRWLRKWVLKWSGGGRLERMEHVC